MGEMRMEIKETNFPEEKWSEGARQDRQTVTIRAIIIITTINTIAIVGDAGNGASVDWHGHGHEHQGADGHVAAGPGCPQGANSSPTSTETTPASAPPEQGLHLLLYPHHNLPEKTSPPTPSESENESLFNRRELRLGR